MDAFLAGTDVSATITLQDSAETALTVESAQYRVLGATGEELVAFTNVSGFVAEDPTVTVTVLAANNALDAESVRETRRVELKLTLDTGNKVILNHVYLIERSDPVLVGINSFQTYDEALVSAMSLGQTPNWDAATDKSRAQALSEARLRLCRLNYRNLNTAILLDQSSIQYFPESTVTSTADIFLPMSLEWMDADQLSRLPARFLTALKLAQVAEAENVLTELATPSGREDGLVLEAIGDVKKMWRSTKPLQLQCSRRALSYLSLYVTMSPRISRT